MTRCITLLALCIAMAGTAQAGILLNFGATVNDNTNSAMHEDGGFVGTNWNLITTADKLTGIVDENGAATNVSLDLGVGSSYLLNWATQPSSAAALGTSMKTGVYADNGHSATYHGSGEVGVRISGLAAGTYDIYISGRNTNTNSGVHMRYYYETVDSSSGNTSYSTGNSHLMYYPSLADLTAAGTLNTWEQDEDYALFQYTIADGEDIVVAASSRGFIATMGIAVVPEPATMALLGIGGIAALLRRRK